MDQRHQDNKTTTKQILLNPIFGRRMKKRRCYIEFCWIHLNLNKIIEFYKISCFSFWIRNNNNFSHFFLVFFVCLFVDFFFSSMLRLQMRWWKIKLFHNEKKRRKQYFVWYMPINRCSTMAEDDERDRDNYTLFLLSFFFKTKTKIHPHEFGVF